jgi:hypothetical protein
MAGFSIFWAVPLALSLVAAVAGIYLASENRRNLP